MRMKGRSVVLWVERSGATRKFRGVSTGWRDFCIELNLRKQVWTWRNGGAMTALRGPLRPAFSSCRSIGPRQSGSLRPAPNTALAKGLYIGVRISKLSGFKSQSPLKRVCYNLWGIHILWGYSNMLYITCCICKMYLYRMVYVWCNMYVWCNYRD